MVRKSIGIATLAAIASLAVTTARAADFAVPPIVQPQLEYSGWYLRGFVGVGMTHANQLEYIINPLNTNDFVIEHSSISDSTFLGGGFGWEVNNWLRFDGTAEYRTKARVAAFGSYTDGAGGVFLDQYDGYIKSLVFLANAFADLGTWNCFTPFVGAGVGATYNTLVDFTDIGSPHDRSRHRPQYRRVAPGLGALRRRCLQRDQELQGRLHLSLSQPWFDHRHHRLFRRLQPQFLQVRQPLFARLHAWVPLDLL